MELNLKKLLRYQGGGIAKGQRISPLTPEERNQKNLIGKRDITDRYDQILQGGVDIFSNFIPVLKIPSIGGHLTKGEFGEAVLSAIPFSKLIRNTKGLRIDNFLKSVQGLNLADDSADVLGINSPIKTINNSEIQFNSNLAQFKNGELVVKDIHSGKEYGVVRNQDGSYDFFRPKNQAGGISQTGYKKDSKDRFNVYNIIPSNQITMKDVEFPVNAYSTNGEFLQTMQPNQEYYFPDQKEILEIPMYNTTSIYRDLFKKRRMQTGGMVDPAQQQAPQQQADPTMEMIMAFFQMMQMSEQDQAAFMQEFQTMSPEEQQQVLGYIQQQLQGGQQQMQQVPVQEQPPADVEAPMQVGMTGGMYKKKLPYGQTGREYMTDYEPLSIYNGVRGDTTFNSGSKPIPEPVRQSAPRTTDISDKDRERLAKKVMKQRDTESVKMQKDVVKFHEDVAGIQQFLYNTAASTGEGLSNIGSKNKPIDGVFGPKTRTAVKNYLGVNEDVSDIELVNKMKKKMNSGESENVGTLITTHTTTDTIPKEQKRTTLFASASPTETTKQKDNNSGKLVGSFANIISNSNNVGVENLIEDLNRNSYRFEGTKNVADVNPLRLGRAIVSGEDLFAGQISDRLKSTGLEVAGRKIVYDPITKSLIKRGWFGGYEKLKQTELEKLAKQNPKKLEELLKL